MKNFLPACATCSIPPHERICRSPNGNGPANCPTLIFADLLDSIQPATWDADTREWARKSSLQERAGYVMEANGLRPDKTRLEEIAEFALRMNIHRLGLAFCSGLAMEAGITSQILKKWGFEVVSVVCKTGCVDKSAIDVPDNKKLHPGGHESMCNPKGQAAVLNHCETGLNIILGLCVGHDSAFMKQSKAPVTVLATKDRVLGHNAMAAIYTSKSYYRNMQPNRKLNKEGNDSVRKL